MTEVRINWNRKYGSWGAATSFCTFQFSVYISQDTSALLSPGLAPHTLPFPSGAYLLIPRASSLRPSSHRPICLRVVRLS